MNKYHLTKEDEKDIKTYLGKKLSEGKLILFTGAGFSSGAKDYEGRNLPLSKDLTKEISALIGIDDPTSKLKDIFSLALSQKRKELCEYLEKRLTVDSISLTETHKLIINQPWYRIYTVNVDDLFRVAQVKFNFDRKIECISNTNSIQGHHIDIHNLNVTYLHGMLEDIPDKVIFSQEQYSERMFFLDAFYNHLSAEILHHPYLFLGSQLDEDIFWYYIYLRKTKGPVDNIDLRPRSFIVTPELSLTRQALLRDFNINWIPQTDKEFCETFLSQITLESQKGFMKIKQRVTDAEITRIPTVSELITFNKNKRQTDHYLLGAEPSWKDMSSGLSIERDKQKKWMKKIKNCLEDTSQKATPLFIFTGTAGDGKTSIAMRIALELSSKGQSIGWIDSDAEVSPHQIIPLVNKTEGLDALFIDTPDMYGLEIPRIISELSLKKKLKFIAVILRSTKVDRIIRGPLLKTEIQREEFSTYRLTDNEINQILDLLENQKLLGALKQKSRSEQIKAFQEKADRQLVVAMIETTSGGEFVKKICEEFENLEHISKQIYCLVAIATSRNHFLSDEDILIGIGENRDNSITNKIKDLTKRGLFINNSGKGLRVRHKLIAQTVSEKLSLDKQLMPYCCRLAYISAVRFKSSLSKSERKRMNRLLKSMINHDFLFKVSSHNDEVRKLYNSIEDFLKDHHHFWLQRGCFELEIGNLSLARNYLNQSFEIRPKDSLVILSLENLNFKEAIANPNTTSSFDKAQEAYDRIVQLIEERGQLDAYPYHILGSQGFAWAKKGIKDVEKRKKHLEDLLIILKKGLENHPRSNEIKDIKDKVQKEIFHFALRN